MMLIIVINYEQKRKRLVQPRQANVLKRKKGALPFILLRLFDPEGLGAEAGRNKSGSALYSPDRQMFSREKKRRSSFYSLEVI
ncbi:hypothetical protein [Rossellomorea vietnamensis]|uniref:hypothetical protein n=1 Tax=Rossellomorea vietnamensis TaxID=218284 RepID=UPI002078DEC0|nr:hypothetical protein [Rossellomorea vietnamensis]